MSRIPIRLSLRKPKNWDVALTTSSSSACIAIPDIKLQDESGRILIDTAADKIREETGKKGHLKRNGQCFKKEDGKGNDLGMKSRNYLNRSGESCSCIPKHRKAGDGRMQKMKKSDHVNLDKENSDNRITQRGRKLKENVFSKFPSGSNKFKSCEVVRKNESKFPNSRIPRLSNKIEKDRKLFYSSTDEEAKENIRVRKGDYLIGVPLGSYEEANALLTGASDIFHLKVSGHRKAKHDPVAGGARRSKRRLVNSKDSGMGSNVSRHSGKGLSGRRTQSSGNLCNGAKILAPSVGRILNPCGAGGVSPRDRNKFCGSLPNHLDDKDVRSGDCTPESIYNGNNNYGEVYTHPAAMPVKNVELLFHKLIPHQDLGGGDQGYGSERSPEDEQPPSLPTESQPRRSHYSTIRRNKEFPFITKENTFEARLEKGSRGLGLSVTGGVDTMEQYPGLIRIKRIFPHQPAWECGVLQLGDIILAANGIPLSGLTNYEALEVLRTTPNDVVLKICRPPGDIFLIPPLSSGEPPPPPRRDPTHVISSSQSNNVSNVLPLPQLIAEPFGEFDVTLKKVNGSLGFTLRKEDESVLGHYVRALVREPALSDGRIRPGDKIVSVNGVDISPMSHEEAVIFLRQSGEEVCLRLYRDPAQTPVSALSPTESHKTFKPKPALRKEAMDMLCDLAVRKLSPSDSSSSSGRSRLKSSSPGSSPRRRKLTKTAPESEDSKPQRPNFLDLCGDVTLRRHKFQMVRVNPDEDADSVLTGTSGSENTQTTVGSATRACISSDECNSDQEGSYHGEPSSMPPLTTSSSVFSYKNPIYQSAHPTVHSGPDQVPDRLSDQDIPDKVFNTGGGTQGLLKWKGVLFTPEDGVDDDAKERIDLNHSSSFRDGGGQVLTVELCRGWNSRLGFSLQGSESGTYISAIYADSVAAKDGRLQAGDQVIMINDESTQDMSTADVIDLLRKVRGTIAITVLRKNPTQS